MDEALEVKVRITDDELIDYMFNRSRETGLTLADIVVSNLMAYHEYQKSLQNEYERYGYHAKGA